MGHERVGALPRTKRWQDVAGGIADAASADGDVSGWQTLLLRMFALVCLLFTETLDLSRPSNSYWALHCQLLHRSTELRLVSSPSTWGPTHRHSNLRAPSASMLQTTSSQPNTGK